MSEFFQLFKGLSRAYGTYAISDAPTELGDKVGGKAITVQGEVTEELWKSHLSGKMGLGIVPITDDGTCYFGAIDIDVYNLDFDELEKDIAKYELPLVICQTKSSGAHLYCFVPNGIQASELRGALVKYSSVLGYPGVEIFPKQEQLAGPEDVGNWINMPYFGDTRKAFIGGRVVDQDSFLSYVETIKVDELPNVSIDPDLDGAPPCLQILAIRGIGEGHRNDALFNFAVLAKLKGGDHKELTESFNQKYMDPPLPRSEVNAIVKSIARKDYFYKCKQAPINAVCDKSACKKCEFGIGNGQESVGISIEALDKICSVPPTWIVQISGKRMRVDTEELVSQTKFAKKCLETVNYLPPTVKQGVWTGMINKLMQEVREIEAPMDAGAEGQFLYHLEQFCTTRAPANDVDELLLGKPWHYDSKTYFRSADLIKYLDQQHFREFKGNQIYSVLRHRIDGVEHHQKNIKGKFINCWSIPQYDSQTEEFTVPRIQEEEF